MESDLNSISGVGIAFDDSGVFHLLADNHIGAPEYYIESDCGLLWVTGEPIQMFNWANNSASFTSHSEVATCFMGSACGSDFMMSYRGEDGSTTANFAKRYFECGDPDFYDAVSLGVTIKTGPAITRSTYDGSLRAFVVGAF
jgi:hypothetical protein